MPKKSKSPEAIRAEIERLQNSLASAEAAEKERKVSELTRLVSRGGRLDEALEWAQAKYGTKRRRAKANADTPASDGGE